MSTPAPELRPICPRKCRQPPSTSTTNPKGLPRYAVSKTRAPPRGGRAARRRVQRRAGRALRLGAGENRAGQHPDRNRDDRNRPDSRLRQTRSGTCEREGIHQRNQQPNADRHATAGQAPVKRADSREPSAQIFYKDGDLGNRRQTAGAGLIQRRLGRPLDPNLDPARPTVAFNHDDRALAPLDRFGKFDLNRNLRPVDRLERPAVLPGQQLDPLCLGGLNPNRAAQQPEADVGDPQR